MHRTTEGDPPSSDIVLLLTACRKTTMIWNHHHKHKEEEDPHPKNIGMNSDDVPPPNDSIRKRICMTTLLVLLPIVVLLLLFGAIFIKTNRTMTTTEFWSVPLRSRTGSTSSASIHCHHPDMKNRCTHHPNIKTNADEDANKNAHQCFLFPKTNDTTITAKTATSNHRQLQEDYELGKISATGNSNGIRLSQGLVATIIATAGKRVSYTSPDAKRSRSFIPFHKKPDGADIFVLPNTNGHYVYMSNSERNIPLLGGVYGVVFDANHQIVEYRNHIRRTTRNCNGGRTPWNTWITCEEAYLPLGGHCWQIDPTQQRRSQKIYMSGFWGGTYEAFAYDDRDTRQSSFYITEDASDGTLRRYRPPPDTPVGWDMLHNRNGVVDYLELIPDGNTFRWTSDLGEGRRSANQYYRNSEGIAITNGTLAFVSKVEKLLFLLNLDTLTYTAVSTETPVLEPGGGSLEAQPDHVISYATQSNGNLLFLTEDGGSTPGLFAYDGTDFMSVLESSDVGYDDDEVTGIAFSPDGTRMYVCYQDAGILLQIQRIDQEPFRNRRTLQWRKGLKL